MATILRQSDGVISFDILVNGSRINDDVQVIEIFVQMEVNKITTATIVVADGGTAGIINEDFKNLEGDDFIPGNDIKILLGYDNKKDSVFEGMIISQGLKINNGQPQLTIICKDKVVKMTKGRFNAIFKDEKDSDAISSIVGKYGLSASIDATASQLPVIMQYNCSDWDFVVIRAEINNMTVLTDKNNLVVKKNDYSSTPDFEINASQSVIDIDLNLDSENISNNYKLTAWDDKNQTKNTITVALFDDLAQGNISAKKLSEVLNTIYSNHYSSTSLSTDELKSWGESLVNQAVLSKIQGRITIPGTAALIAGDMVTLSGLSNRFNGKLYISKINHAVDNGNWITTIYVGKSTQWHSSLPDVEENRASELLPATNGTQIATVKKIVEDPDNNYRVLVTLPVFTGTGQEDGIWARLAVPYASADAGFFFFPEIGDEVILTFINNDPRYPVINGSLYNGKSKPKETPDYKNQFKSIYSKSGIKIRFDDKDKVLEIETPGGNSFTLDDKEQKINMKDISGNSILMDNSGIALDSSKDIKLTAKGDIDISATGGVNIKGNADVKVDGMNVQLSAKTGFTAKGNASAEISASGQTTVKGAMVMIN